MFFVPLENFSLIWSSRAKILDIYSANRTSAYHINSEDPWHSFARRAVTTSFNDLDLSQQEFEHLTFPHASNKYIRQINKNVKSRKKASIPHLPSLDLPMKSYCLKLDHLIKVNMVNSLQLS